jgi:hypothetical protein
MQHAVKRATKPRQGKEDGDSKEDEEEEACQPSGDDGSDGEDASRRTSIFQITTIPHNLH